MQKVMHQGITETEDQILEKIIQQETLEEFGIKKYIEKQNLIKKNESQQNNFTHGSHEVPKKNGNFIDDASLEKEK